MQTTDTNPSKGKRLTREMIDLPALYEKLFQIIDEIGEKVLIQEKVISTSSLWRWKKDVNKIAPTCDLVLCVLQRHSGLKHIVTIAEHYGSIVHRFLQLSFPAIMSDTDNRVIDTKAIYLEDEFDYQIYYMCCNERGSTLQEIIYTLGHIAVKKANISEKNITDELITSSGMFGEVKVKELIEKKVLIQQGKYLKCDDTFTYIQGDNGLQQSIKLLSNNINPKGWQTGQNVFYLTAESVEPEVAKSASAVLSRAYKEASDMLTQNRSDSDSAVPYVISVAGEELRSTKELSNKELH